MITRNLSLLAMLLACGTAVDAQYSCAAVLCAQGYYCKEVPAMCFRARCPLHPVCLPMPSTRAPVVNKPGTCPGYRTRHFPTCRAQCSSDSSCPGSQKCCFSGCGMRCVTVQSTQPVKYGTCPRAPYGLVTPCVVRCTSDSSCSGSLKCCSWGCSRQCKPPAETTTSKPGYCPQVFSYRCVMSYNKCQSDHQCGGALKCCRGPCGKECMYPRRYQFSARAVQPKTGGTTTAKTGN